MPVAYTMCHIYHTNIKKRYLLPLNVFWIMAWKNTLTCYSVYIWVTNWITKLQCKHGEKNSACSDSGKN